MRPRLLAVLLLLPPVLLSCATAKAGGTTVRKVEDGRACFNRPDAVATRIGCVEVGTASGSLGEGLRTGAGKWIVEVRDDKKNVVDDVGKDEEIIVLSTQACAKRERGKKTFTLYRFDESAKPLKTDVVWLQNQNQIENLGNFNDDMPSFGG